MATLTKEQILGADDVAREAVEVPEWGGKVFVSEMTAASRMEWELDVFDGEGKPLTDNWQVKLVARCVVDKNGNRLFSADDIEALGRKSKDAIRRLYDKANALNGFGEGAAQDVEKN